MTKWIFALRELQRINSNPLQTTLFPRVTKGSYFSDADLVRQAEAMVLLRHGMICIPEFSKDMSYNSRRQITVSHFKDLGVSYCDQDIDSIINLAARIEDAGESYRKASISDLHYLERKRRLEAQNHRCAVCGITFAVGSAPNDPRGPELDHILPFALGGNSNENLRIICKLCNTSKGAELTGQLIHSVAMNYSLLQVPRNLRQIIYWVFERDRSTCRICKETTSLYAELNIYRLSQRARLVYDNLGTACLPCWEALPNEKQVRFRDDKIATGLGGSTTVESSSEE